MRAWLRRELRVARVGNRLGGLRLLVARRVGARRLLRAALHRTAILAESPPIHDLHLRLAALRALRTATLFGHAFSCLRPRT